MRQTIVETVRGVHVPWGTDQRELAKSVCNYLGCQAFAVGVINLKAPETDNCWPPIKMTGVQFQQRPLDQTADSRHNDGKANRCP